MKIVIEFYMFKLTYILTFSFNKFGFWNKTPKKYTFGRNQKKINITIEFFIFKIVRIPVFSLNWQLRFFGPNLPTKGSYFEFKT